MARTILGHRRARRGRIDRLLLDVYGCVLRPDAWPTFLESTCVRHCAFLRQPSPITPSMMLKATPGLPTARPPRWRSTAGRLARWTLDARHAVEGPRPGSVEVVRGEDLVPWSRLVQTDYYNDFARRYDYVDTTAVATVDADGQSTTNITLPRGARQRRHDPGLLHVLRLIGPHLQQAMTIQRRLDEARREREWLQVLTQHFEPTLVLAGDGHVEFMNPSAEELLSRRPELSVDGGRLGAGQHACSRASYCRS